MSAFIGPIHHQLYRKIGLQEGLTEYIIQAVDNEESRQALRGFLEQSVGSGDTPPLEEVVDHSNIHGWMEQRLQRAERRFALLVTTLLQNEAELLPALCEVLEENGKSMSFDGIRHALDAYKAVESIVLEGMPCDRASRIAEQSEDAVRIEQLSCLHSPFWTEVNGDVAHYYTLRTAWLNGLLSKSDCRLRTAL